MFTGPPPSLKHLHESQDSPSSRGSLEIKERSKYGSLDFQGKNAEVACQFPSPVGHILSELSTKTHPSWVSLHSMALSFIELSKAWIHVIILINFPWLWISFWRPWDYNSCFFSVPLDGWDKRLVQASLREAVGKRGSCSGGQGHS